jgi:phage-related protein
MNNYTVLFYITRRGESPVDQFLDSLGEKDRAKIESYILILQEKGHTLLRPYADYVRGKIYESRPGRFRIFYSFFFKNHILLLHAIKKKSFRLNPKDIEQAERNLTDYVMRYQGGEIPL